MGSYAILKTGRLTLDEQKFGEYGYNPTHSPLFQREDLIIEDREGYEGEILKWPLSRKPLAHIADRLDLLGYTLDWIDRRLGDLVSECYDEAEELERDHPSHRVAAADVRRIITAIRVDDERPERASGLQYYIVFVLADCLANAFDHKDVAFFEPICQQLGVNAILRLLAENPDNAVAIVEWDFGEGVVEEYVTLAAFPAPLTPNQQFLLVTEGRSDVRVLEKALHQRSPHIRDFFYFVDMTEGYPFGGIGNLHNFCKGLAAIGVHNRTIIIYDNDAEGLAKYRETRRLSLPPNIRVEHLATLSSDNGPAPGKRPESSGGGSKRTVTWGMSGYDVS